jgi:TATA-box binding protein (TBP) (component of TFIID and TFIIIB)
MDLNDEWERFLTNADEQPTKCSVHGPTPSSTPIYISTNTIISFLNQPIDLKTTFWKIPIIPYNSPTTGVIKKQMKFNSLSSKEVDDIESYMSMYEYGYCNIIHHIETPSKYKDVRKVTLGISKKDIMSYRIKPKGAFYNCFVVIIRVYVDMYKEFHVKIFNTGKIEIPGIQNVKHVSYIIDILLSILKPYYPSIMYTKSCEETVLINSNFNCGYFINRNELYHVLRKKYNVSAVYDPCSYPGIQCKIYYNKKVVTTVEPIAISFMIFRTGSILIVGKCTEEVIHKIYEYLSDILYKEYTNVVDYNCVHNKKDSIEKKIKRFILLK